MKLRNKKTGEIQHSYPVIRICDGKTDICFASLTELNEEWEDYIEEPLIKDEKIRKAVRAWAEAQGLTEVYLASNGYEVYGGVDDWVMQFEGEPFPFADKNRLYTIDELCGDEL